MFDPTLFSLHCRHCGATAIERDDSAYVHDFDLAPLDVCGDAEPVEHQLEAS
jgi:hypothetical protein